MLVSRQIYENSGIIRINAFGKQNVDLDFCSIYRNRDYDFLSQCNINFYQLYAS